MIVFVPMASAEKFCKGCKFNEEEFPKTYPVIMKYVHEIQDKWQPSEFMARGDVIVLIYDVKINKDGTIPWIKFADYRGVLPYLSKEEDLKLFKENIEALLFYTPMDALPEELEEEELIVSFYFCYTPYVKPDNWLYIYVDDENTRCMPSNNEKLRVKIRHNSKVKRGLFRKKPIMKGHFDANLHSDDLRKK